MNRLTVVALSAAFWMTACNDDKAGNNDKAPTGNGDDSGTLIDDTGPTTEPCIGLVTSVDPGDGASEVYYRSPLEVAFEGDGASASFNLVDASGNPASYDTTWSEGNVKASLAVVLEPLTTYTLTATLCESTKSATFTTSELGTPLVESVEELVGSTYAFRLSSDARITEPAFLDLMADTYLTVPLLFSVYEADASSIHWVGALGYQNNDGSYVPADDTRWDFPAADFTTSPYFYAEADYIAIGYSTYSIPVERFTLEATLSSDGERIEMGRATGYADSRSMGDLVMQPDNPSAVCDIAVSAGVECVPCEDGEVYCLYIVAEDITATRVDGLSLDLNP